MARVVRDGSGLLFTVAALAALGWGVVELRDHDYLSAALLLLTGVAVLRAAVELLRPTVGE
ncbi:MAG: hypothetical protein H6719_03650 [Sandaracinaceae bacterium]|nr:hypothetical protein [Sandaracinaceae bacterium]